MAKRKMSKAKIKKAHKQAERLKGKRGITNPYALATYQAKKGHKIGGRRKKK